MKEYPYWWDTVPALRAGNLELRTENSEPGTPNSERGTPNSESRTPHAELRTSSAPGIQNPGIRTDVIIIGAGYTGLAAARVLARAGASVLVLEREHVAFGASSRNGGQVLTGLKLHPQTLVARYGQSKARALFDVSRESIHSLEALLQDERIACDYERC